MFQVIPGDHDNLLIFFQGGGGCWDERSSAMGLCKQNVTYDGAEGIFDRNNSLNPFRDYTIVTVGYCTGDAHAGNATHSWKSLPGGRAMQVGYINARAVVNWAKDNFGGRILNSLVLTGSSAGSLGVQMWAKTLLTEFQYADAAVIADSFAGVFPTGLQGPMLHRFGACETGLLDGSLLSDCNGRKIQIQSVYEDAMIHFPQVAFANIDSKVDQVQIAYYEAIRRSFGDMLVDPITPVQFAGAVTAVYQRYADRENWVSYAVNSKQHMFLPESCLYSTVPDAAQLLGDVVSSETLQRTVGEEALVHWLARFPVKQGRSVQSVCQGSLQDRAGDIFDGFRSMFNLNATLPRLRIAGISGMFSCSPAVVGKTFVRSREAAALQK